MSYALKKPMNFGTSPHPSHHIVLNSKKKIENPSDFEILCINCMKMIKCSLVAEHSMSCSRVQNEVKLIDQCSILQQADYKLKKLKESLNDLNRKTNEGDKYYIRMLTEYCEDGIKISESTRPNILKCREIIYNLKGLENGFKGTPSILIHMKRLQVITKEKYEELLKYYKEIANCGLARLKSKEELKAVVTEKEFKLRTSINAVSEARLSHCSGKKMRDRKSVV